MTVKGVVFDMDGLMFDTENLTYKLQKEILGDMALEFSLEDYKLTIGKRVADLEAFFHGLFGADFDMTDFRSKCRESFKSYTDKYGVPIKDGLVELLGFLKEKGVKTALCTSTSRHSAERMLRIAGVFDYFDALVCAEDVTNGKPHPEPFLKSAEKIKIVPESCIALEDSFNGIISAYRAGFIPIMIPDLIEPDGEISGMCRAVLSNLSMVKEFIN